MNVICAYNVNLDAIYDLRGEDLPIGPRPQAKERISGVDDLISALLHCMQEGIGAEVLIEDAEVSREIESLLPWQYRLGGNAGIMADVLASLGATPILNAPFLSRRLAELLHPGIRIPVPGGLAEPLQASGDADAVHFVLQFREGQAVQAEGTRVVARADDRLIATFDPPGSRLSTSQEFDSYCLEHIREFEGALVSGFHLVPFGLHEEVFHLRTEQLRSWKRSHPGLYIHAEMGGFERPQIMKRLLDLLPADSLGMNEHELSMVAGSVHGWRCLMDASVRLREELGLSRVAVHTRDYIMSILDGLIDPEEEIAALARGVDAAASLAATGSATKSFQVGASLAGIQALEEFCSEGAKRYGRGAFLSCGACCIMVPSAHLSMPRFTVGLGDTATAAIFYGELEALRKSRRQGL